MAKRRVLIEVEADLHKAIEKEALEKGTTKDEVVRQCAQKFLRRVSDTSPRNKATRKSA